MKSWKLTRSIYLFLILSPLALPWKHGAFAQGATNSPPPDTTVVAPLGLGVGVTVPSGLAFDYHRIVTQLIPGLRLAIFDLESVVAADSVLIETQRAESSVLRNQILDLEALNGSLREANKSLTNLSQIDRAAYLRERRLRKWTFGGGVVILAAAIIL